MVKRIIGVFAVAICLLSVCLFRIYALTIGGGELAQAAASQREYTMTVQRARGTVYDRNLKALTGGEPNYLAAVAPSTETAAALSRLLPQDRMKSVYELLTNRQPFLMPLDEPVEAPGVTVFTVNERYRSPALAPHLVGYLDGGGQGVTGAEKAFNELLSEVDGKLQITYHVDALDHILPSDEPTVKDTTANSKAGVALTLEERVQEAAQEAADGRIEKGAVVVLDVRDGSLLASVSLPAFQPEDISKALDDKNGPLLDRTGAAYSVGSVFKIVSAAAALEYGVDPEEKYDCKGSIEVAGQKFDCYDGDAHGEVNLEEAIAKSCNSYFVQLMQKIPQAQFLSKARLLGFGSSAELLPGLSTAPGVLPTLNSLKNERAMANFSFGQGDLTATPLQIAAMTAAVANHGIYRSPTAYLGMVDAEGKLAKNAIPAKTQAMTEKTTELLRTAMEESVETGTSKLGKPTYVKAAAKTATAQTGRYLPSGEEEVVSWYTGFFPAENPRYAVTVMVEGGSGGGVSCGPVFRAIADELYPDGN